MSAILKRLGLGALAMGALAAALGWFLHQFTFGSGLVNLSYDLLHVASGSKSAPSDAIIVYLDEKSHEELAQPYNRPWDRAMHARLLDRLTATGAKVVVLDIVFSDPGPSPEADELLAAAIRRNRRTILGVDHIQTGPAERKFVTPLPLLRDAAVDLGSVEIVPHRDLIVRVYTASEQVPALSWAAAKWAGASVTARVAPGYSQPPTDSARVPNAWIRYYGPAGVIPSVSYADALLPERTPAPAFSNKVVFVGARIMTKLAFERKDEYRNPYNFWVAASDTPFISGVEIHATKFLNIARGDWLRRMAEPTELLLLTILGGAAGWGLMRLRPIPAIVVAIVALAALGIASRELFIRQHIWFPTLIPFVQVAFALAAAVAINSIRLYVENRMFVQSLELYLSPKLVRKFSRNRDRKLLQPGAEKQKLTIMFSDIANFTRISEGMDSDELAILMNTYFQGAVSECIHSTDGTVVKYIGDGIFAFWNAPDPQSDHALRACLAAIRFRNLTRKPIAGRTLATRIGLHTGVANVGNFGGASRIDYTAIGENINLASRIEGLNKHLGTDLLITLATKKEIGDRFLTRRLGDFKLKGFEKSVTVFELVGTAASSADARPVRDDFTSALDLFQAGDLQAANNAFKRILEHTPSDGPTQFYLRHLESLLANPLPQPWQGIVELTEK